MPDLFTATAPDGTRLPVIDVTNPAFAVPDTDAEIAALGVAALHEEARRGPLQRLVLRLMLRRLARASRLVGALQAARSGFLGGLATYVMKLGPDNLVPPYDTEIDRQVLRSPQATSMRIRLHQVAHLLAEALAPALAAAPGAPLHIVEIAGGPSADALNALLLLEREGRLAGRRVRIDIYDVDADGPAFAASLLEALHAGPLRGRDIATTHVPGNWADTARLAALLDGIPAEAVIAATSEGGLFEYGSDADIAGVLGTLAPRVGIVTGSVTRDDRLNRLLGRMNTVRLVPRGLARFGALIAPSGYGVVRSRPSPLSDQVVLAKS